MITQFQSLSRYFLISSLFIFIPIHNIYACQCEYLAYYRATSQAELLLMDQKYEEAYQLYLGILKEFEGFDKDYMNAAILAAKFQDTSKVFSFLEESLKHGHSFKRIRKMDAFLSYQSLPQWIALSEKADQLMAQSVRSPDLVKELEKMFKKDQRVRSFPFTLRLNNKLLFDSMWDRIDSTNYYRVKEMTLKHGFPGHKIAGFSKKVSDRPPLYILVHNYYLDPDTSFEGVLYTEMCKGNLHAKNYAWIIDRRVRIKKETERYGTVFTREVYRPDRLFSDLPAPFNSWSEEKLRKINQEREQIGLSKIEEAYNWRKLMGSGFHFYF